MLPLAFLLCPTPSIFPVLNILHSSLRTGTELETSPRRTETSVISRSYCQDAGSRQCSLIPRSHQGGWTYMLHRSHDMAPDYQDLTRPRENLRRFTIVIVRSNFMCAASEWCWTKADHNPVLLESRGRCKFLTTIFPTFRFICVADLPPSSLLPSLQYNPVFRRGSTKRLIVKYTTVSIFCATIKASELNIRSKYVLMTPGSLL